MLLSRFPPPAPVLLMLLQMLRLSLRLRLLLPVTSWASVAPPLRGTTVYYCSSRVAQFCAASTLRGVLSTRASLYFFIYFISCAPRCAIYSWYVRGPQVMQ